MSVSHLYADLGRLHEISDLDGALDVEAIEEEKLDSFEKGYQAGWDDAVKAHENDQGRISSEFAQNLQDISFTFHEALSKMSLALEPLLNLMVTKVLPDLAHASLGAHVQQQLSALAKGQLDSTIEIAVAPENLEAVQLLLENVETRLPFEILTESSMTAGQVYLRNGTRECEINLDEVLKGISEAVTAFFHHAKEVKVDE